jgi:hypothetical protein
VLLCACSRLPPDVDSSLYVPLTLAPAALGGVRDERANFRALFCSEPGGDDEQLADACGIALRHFRDEGQPGVSIAADTLPRQSYHVALALGIGWDCVRDLIDENALPTAALRRSGYSAQLLEVEGMSSSERNADITAAALSESVPAGRRLILIGYSKGAVDLMVALQRYPALASRTAAFISVAGSVGGSPVAENTSDHTTGLLRFSPWGDCSGGDWQAMDSLRPVKRHAWLRDHLPLPVPAYSLVTAPSPDRVSPALRSSYRVLGAVHPLNDGALLHWDQLLPGSTLLGYANADHWAVAVPVQVEDVPLGSLLLTNGYPRSRLWRALVDFVVADLERAAGSTPPPDVGTPPALRRIL